MPEKRVPKINPRTLGNIIAEEMGAAGRGYDAWSFGKAAEEPDANDVPDTASLRKVLAGVVEKLNKHFGSDFL